MFKPVGERGCSGGETSAFHLGHRRQQCLQRSHPTLAACLESIGQRSHHRAFWHRYRDAIITNIDMSVVTYDYIFYMLQRSSITMTAIILLTLRRLYRKIKYLLFYNLP